MRITILPMQTMSLKLPESLLARLEEESRQRRTHQSSLVRRRSSVNCWPPASGAGRSCYDLATDLAGLIGLPEDLATNPRYLKDFGK